MTAPFPQRGWRLYLLAAEVFFVVFIATLMGGRMLKGFMVNSWAKVNFEQAPLVLDASHNAGVVRFHVHPWLLGREKIEWVPVGDGLRAQTQQRGAVAVSADVSTYPPAQETSSSLEAKMRGRKIGTLPVQVRGKDYVARVWFEPGELVLTEKTLSALVKVRSEPQNAPMDNLIWRAEPPLAIQYGSSQLKIWVTQDAFASPSRRKVSVGSNDRELGALEVALQPLPALKSIHFQPSTVILSKKVSTTEVAIISDPPVPDEVLNDVELVVEKDDCLEARHEKPATLVLRGNPSKIKPFGTVETVVVARARGKEIGRLNVEMKGPDEIERVTFSQPRVVLTPDAPRLKVGYTATPQGFPADALRWEARPQGLDATGQSGGVVAVSIRPQSFSPGETTGKVLAFYKETSVGELDVEVQMPQLEVAAGREQASQLQIDYPKKIRTGAPCEIRVAVENPYDVERIGTIAVSIDSNGVKVVQGQYDHFAPYERRLTHFIQQGTTWNTEPKENSVFPKMHHVEMYKPNWEGTGAEKRKLLTIPLTFTTAGTVDLYVRGTFATRFGDKTIIDKNLPEQGTQDEQGLPCLVVHTEVVE